jgi:cytochrome c biogenesis protein CcmG, thiol:disulfide interchange protein DsbE
MRFAIPAVVLAALLVLLGVGLTLDPREIPSPLIGKPAPAFALPALDGAARVTQDDLRGRPLLVNFFASWCEGCQVEHGLLLQLAREQRVEIVGVDYKDTTQAVQRWLQHHGNPYRTVLADAAGAVGIDWGVYGVPETFVLDASGTIVHKHVGPLTAAAWRDTIAPLLGRAAAAP